MDGRGFVEDAYEKCWMRLGDRLFVNLHDFDDNFALRVSINDMAHG